MDRIIDKLKKLLALAERGEQGEADNARRLLEAELRRHGLTLNYLGSKSDAFCDSTYSKYQKEVYIALSDIEYIDISNMYDFFKAQYRKERKRLLHDMIQAFVQKHSLFDSTPSERPDDDREIDWDELKRILALSSTMEDVTFRKQLTK